MKIIEVLPMIQDELEIAEYEWADALKYMKVPCKSMHIDMIKTTKREIKSNYIQLINIEKGGDKEKLINDVNKCYIYLTAIYEALYVVFASLPSDATMCGVLMSDYVESQKEVCKYQIDKYKNIRY